MLSASYNDDAVNCEQDYVDVANPEPAESIFTSTCHVSRLRSGRPEPSSKGGGTEESKPTNSSVSSSLYGYVGVKTVTARVSPAQ